MNNKFQAGDLVDILPWSEVKEHLGISQSAWTEVMKRNPHRVELSEFDNSVYLSQDYNRYYWPVDALQYHDEGDHPSVDDFI